MLTTMLLYCALGAVAGVLAGLLGVGGGIVIVPMLSITFDYLGFAPDPLMKLALGSSMASIIFTSISSSKAHSRKGFVDWKIVWTIAPGIIVGTFGGSFLAAHLPSNWLRIIFGIFLLIVSYQMFAGAKPKASRQLPKKIGMTVWGLGIGIISSFVGIGGGSLLVPFMLWHNVEGHRAVGTSAGIGLPLAIAGALGYLWNGIGVPDRPDYSLGYIYLPATIGIVVISMLVAPYGAKISQALPVSTLKKCFSVILFCVAIKMLLQSF
ncbi:MAG: sulfite exporter TauE/SafE family protein [Desulfovibrionaceae bacterium]|nr:sulfite exporter TauE/SafE family protein [Desulfovibrionaceae bacterium]